MKRKKFTLEDKSLRWQKNYIFKFTQTRVKITTKKEGKNLHL